MNRRVISLAAFLLASSMNISPARATSAADNTLLNSVEATLAQNKRPSESDFEALGELISREPQNYRAHLVLGQAYESMALGKQAVEQYIQAVKLSPNDPKPLVDLATARIRYKDTENISGLIATAAAKFPADPNVTFLKGYDAMKHHNTALALKCFRAAYAKKPDIPWLRPYFAELMLKQGAAPMALYLAKQEIDQNPNNPNPKACEVAGLALIDLQHYAEAVDYLEVAGNDDLSKADLHEKLGTLAAWSGRHEKAVTPLLVCLAGSVNAMNDHQKLCNLLTDVLRHSKKATVMTELDDILQKFPPAATNAYFNNAVGQVFDQVGWHDAAMARYELAIKLLQENKGGETRIDGRPYLNLAKDTELYTQDYQKALLLYKQAQQLSLPPDTHISDYVSRLEDRMAMRKQDVAWRLKDWLSRHCP